MRWTDLPVVPICRGRASLISTPNHRQIPPIPCPREGRCASSRTLVRDAVDDAAPRPGHVDRSTRLTIFWHCGLAGFSFRTALKHVPGNQPSTVLPQDEASKGSGNADSRRNGWSSGYSGRCRPYPGDSGCVLAHPASWRASASYRPLRAVWAVCAWALRGCARSTGPFSAQKKQRTS